MNIQGIMMAKGKCMIQIVTLHNINVQKDVQVNIRLTEDHQIQAELLKYYTIMQEMTLRETVTSTIQFGTPLIKIIDKMLGSKEDVYNLVGEP
jgi:hypothetical protein